MHQMQTNLLRKNFPPVNEPNGFVCPVPATETTSDRTVDTFHPSCCVVDESRQSVDLQVFHTVNYQHSSKATMRVLKKRFSGYALPVNVVSKRPSKHADKFHPQVVDCWFPKKTWPGPRQKVQTARSCCRPCNSSQTRCSFRRSW